MSSHERAHVVLTHVEVIGDADVFAVAWRAWIDDCVRTADGLVEATLHREQTGRRMLLIQRWQDQAAYEAWSQSDAARTVEPVFARHAVRSATSQWNVEGE